MKHFINLTLLLSFLTLAGSGLLRFFQPFDLVVTRVHIAFAAATLLLVALHLSSRGKYFLSLFSTPRKEKTKRTVPVSMLFGVVAFWGYLLVAAIWNLPPIDWLVSTSYESQHAREIFRDNSKTAFKLIQSGLQVKRTTESAASIHLDLAWGAEFKPELANGQPLGGAHPQLAIWAETEDGSILETLYVSQACATAETFVWDGVVQSRDDVLPVWYSRYKKIMGREPELVDGVSSATPISDFSLEGYLALDAQPFAMYVEVNVPNDVNGFFHHDQQEESEGFTASGIGQPSVVYEAFIFPEEQKNYYLLELTSHSGRPFQENNELVYDLDSLTSARKIIEMILLNVKWPEQDD